MVETLILDLDGPILDGKNRHYQCYSDILVESGFRPIPIDDYWEMKRNRVDRHKQLTASGANEIYDHFLSEWMERIEERRYLKFDRLQSGAISKLKEWKDKGLRLILVTMRNNQDNLFWQLKELELYSFFDFIKAVGSATGINSKVEAVRTHIDGTEKNKIFWIGDTEVDVKSAKRLGLNIIALDGGLRSWNYLESLKPYSIRAALKDIDLS